MRPRQTLVNLKILLNAAAAPSSSVGMRYSALTDSMDVSLQRAGKLLLTQLERIEKSPEDDVQEENSLNYRLVGLNDDGWDEFEEGELSSLAHFKYATCPPPSPPSGAFYYLRPSPASTRGISSVANSIVSSLFGKSPNKDGH